MLLFIIKLFVLFDNIGENNNYLELIGVKGNLVRELREKRGYVLLEKKIGKSQTKTFVRISKRKTSFWERIEKSQEQGELLEES